MYLEIFHRRVTYYYYVLLYLKQIANNSSEGIDSSTVTQHKIEVVYVYEKKKNKRMNVKKNQGKW